MDVRYFLESHFNPWVASPFVFAAGVALLYAKWPIARVSAVFVIVCALVLAVSPGDSDDWWMAVCEVGLGGLLLVCVRPRWLRDWRSLTHKPQFRFGLRELLVAWAVIGICLTLVLGAVKYQAREYRIRELMRTTIQLYGGAIAFQGGSICYLSGGEVAYSPDPFGASARVAGVNHFYSGPSEDAIDDRALFRIVDEHTRIRFLDLRRSQVTTAGMLTVGNLSELECLAVRSDQLDASDVAFLQETATLRLLVIESADPKMLSDLRETLPQCEVK